MQQNRNTSRPSVRNKPRASASPARSQAAQASTSSSRRARTEERAIQERYEDAYSYEDDGFDSGYEDEFDGSSYEEGDYRQSAPAGKRGTNLASGSLVRLVTVILTAVVLVGGAAWAIARNNAPQPAASSAAQTAPAAASSAVTGTSSSTQASEQTAAPAAGASSQAASSAAASSGEAASSAEAVSSASSVSQAASSSSDAQGASSATVSSSASAGSSQAASSSAQAADGTYQVSGRPESFSISFVSTGDMIFGRQVGDYVDMYGGAAPLARVSEHLAAADVTIGNLEAPLSDDMSDPLWTKDVFLISRPAAIEGLKESDFTFLSLANNHAMDYGWVALEDTIQALDGAGIKYSGAGINYDEAWKIATTEVDGVSIAFLSLTDVIPENFLAYENSAGVAAARIDMDYTCEVVSKMAAEYDIVVLAMHWGEEYQDYTTEWLQDVPAHQLVDAGADVILGNHPHVIQGIEFYKGALISYSQGDFVFDHFSTRKTGETFFLDFNFTENGIENVVVTPIYLEDPYGIPYVLQGQEAADILDRLEQISIGFNTSYERVGDTAIVTPTDGAHNPAAECSTTRVQGMP